MLAILNMIVHGGRCCSRHSAWTSMISTVVEKLRYLRLRCGFHHRYALIFSFKGVLLGVAEYGEPLSVYPKHNRSLDADGTEPFSLCRTGMNNLQNCCNVALWFGLISGARSPFHGFSIPCWSLLPSIPLFHSIPSFHFIRFFHLVHLFILQSVNHVSRCPFQTFPFFNYLVHYCAGRCGGRFCWAE